MEITPVRATGSPQWDALADHLELLRDVHLRDLFAADPHRGEKMVVEAADLVLDYSKNRLTPETVQLLVALAERAGLRDRIEAMFTGEHINVTEDRAVLHVALRAPAGSTPRRRRPGRRARRPWRAGEDGCVRQTRAHRGVARLYRQEDQEHRQHRHWWL